MNEVEWDDETLPYVAGFLDGEGCFSVDDHRWKIRVSCANTNRPIIEWLQHNFGGSFCKNATRRRKPHHRRTYSWSVVSRDAHNFCCAVAPYLKEKAEQALLLIAIQQTMGVKRKGRFIPPDVLQERNRLSQKLKELKHVSWEK